MTAFFLSGRRPSADLVLCLLLAEQKGDRLALNCPPAGARDPDANIFDRAPAFRDGFGLHVRESVTNKADQHGEAEAMQDPEQSGAFARWRSIQHFEGAALLIGKAIRHQLLSKM